MTATDAERESRLRLRYRHWEPESNGPFLLGLLDAARAEIERLRALLAGGYLKDLKAERDSLAARVEKLQRVVDGCPEPVLVANYPLLPSKKLIGRPLDRRYRDYFLDVIKPAQSHSEKEE